MTNSRKHHLLFFLLFVLFSALFVVSIQSWKALGSDALVKIIQGKSLLKNNFASEQLDYSSRVIDPEYRFYPYKSVYFLQNEQGEFVGQYPVLFSSIVAIVAHFFPVLKTMVFLSWLALIGIFFILSVARLRVSTLYFLAGGSYLVLMVGDISELVFFVFLFYAGFVILYNSLGTTDMHLIMPVLGGILVGLSVCLRIESMLFICCLGFIIIITGNFRQLFRRHTLAWFLALGFIIFTFIIFNYYNYGHFLGNRFLSTQSGFALFDTSKLWQMVSLLFGENMKIGFFGFIPAFLVMLLIIFGSRIFKRFTFQDRMILYASVLFVILAAYIAPNAGEVSWGPRYLVCAILPMAIISDRLFDLITELKPLYQKIWKYTQIISVVWSMLLILAAATMLGKASRENQKFRSSYAGMQYDFMVFDSGWMASQVGMDYFKGPVYLIQSTADLPVFYKMIDDNYATKKFLYVQSDFPVIEGVSEGTNAAYVRKALDMRYNSGQVIEKKLYKLVPYQMP